MRIRTVCAGVALVVAALMMPFGLRAGQLLTECIGGLNASMSCGDPGIPLAKGIGLLREAAGSPIPVDQSVFDLKLADVNGDGALDAVVLRRDPNTLAFLIEVRPGDGHGGLGSPITSPVGGGIALALGDLNLDGRPDVAVLGSLQFASSFVEILLGAGNGTFTSAASVPFTVYTITKGIVIDDVTSDGKPDIVTLSNAAGGHFAGAAVADVFAGDGTGAVTFLAQSQGTVFVQPHNAHTIDIRAFAVTDVNGDGHRDILTNSDGVAVWFGDGAGSFTQPVTVGAQSEFLSGIGSSIAAADLNGDARPDIVQFDGLQFRVVLNSAAGFSTASTTRIYQAVPDQTETYSTSMALADIDGDGAIDAVAMVAASSFSSLSGPQVSVLFGDGAGGFSNPSFYPAPTAGRLAVGDVNGDGRPDVVAATTAAAQVLFQTTASDLTVLLHVSGVEIGALPAAVDAMGLPAGTANSLHSKLKAAAASRERGNTKATANQLNAFINHVNALQQSGKLTGAQAASLIALTQQVIAGL